MLTPTKVAGMPTFDRAVPPNLGLCMANSQLKRLQILEQIHDLIRAEVGGLAVSVVLVGQGQQVA